jgi:hypothetical protein
MMSDSLKDIVSIGQLTGDMSNIVLFIDDMAHDLELFSFTRDPQTLRCLVFASKEIISLALRARKISATVKFDNEPIGSGKVVTIGYEPMTLGNVTHDMLMLHMKRDN